MCASVREVEARTRNKRETWRRHGPETQQRFRRQHGCWDPKDGELCLERMKLEETLVEVRRRSDVQIDGRIWA
jgi:hypothetical protein